jgi:hypothetical protein
LNQILHSLPASLLFFLLVGVFAFGFFQALPASLLNRYKVRWVVPVLVVMWAVLYGSANIELGVAPSLGDVGLFGFIFLIIYIRTRNSLGPIVAYALIAEEPAWVALALISTTAYVVSLYVKVAWSLIALAIVTGMWARRRSSRYNRVFTPS